MSKKIAVYHPFHDLPDNYSLSHIVKEQMLMLTEHDFETHFVTSNRFTDPVPKHVQVHAVLPYKNPQEVYKAAEPILKQMSTILTHDVVYLNVYKDHAEALRKIAKENPQIKWLHWSHSAPNPKDKHKPFPNSIYIGLNRADIPLLAEQYQVPEPQCEVVYNPVSPDIFFDWHPFTKHLVTKYNLLCCDILIVYPLDTGRFAAKGGYKIIKLAEKIREADVDAKVVFVNAAANTKERTKLVKSLQKPHVIFTSLENKAFEVVVPQRVVRELMQLSNVFPLLSLSEGCSLIMLEAALTKNLVILNEDFPPMREFGEIDHVLYMKVSSTRATTNYAPNEDQYYKEQAKRIIEEVERDKSLRFNRKVRQRFNREWIWKNQLQPLIQ